MHRLIARLATLAVTLPLVAGLTAGSAHAAESVTVPGCFGAGSNVYCDLTVTIGVPAGVRTYEVNYPVCVSVCVYVPLIWAETAPGEPASICYRYRRLDYTTVSDCAGLGGVDGTVEYVSGVVGDVGGGGVVEYVSGVVRDVGGGVVEYVLARLDGLPEEVLAYVRELLTGDPCSIIVGILWRLGYDNVHCAD